jgi:NAD(P)-dependent dehydrogenase (short-subunit alcohol dehydrogenase family)
MVYVSDIDDEGGKQTTLTAGAQANYLRLDVRSEEDWSRVTEHVLSIHGRIDVVVNNAGITGFENGFIQHDPEHASVESWHAVHATNLDGAFLGCKYAIAAMRKHGEGAIINSRKVLSL